MLEMLTELKQEGIFVSRTKHSSTWHYRSLELIVHFDNDMNVIKITGKNRRGE